MIKYIECCRFKLNIVQYLTEPFRFSTSTAGTHFVGPRYGTHNRSQDTTHYVISAVNYVAAHKEGKTTLRSTDINLIQTDSLIV